MLRTVNPPSRWKILVVDPHALRLLNGVCSMSDVLSENVSVVEGLTNKRQPHPDTEAIYFITPSQDSVRLVIDDYVKGRPPYAAVHLFTTSPLSDSLFDRIKNSPVVNYLRTCKELNIDFFAPDAQTFLFDYPDAWYSLFNPQAPSLLRYELDIIAKRIVSVLATLGEYPYIRYHTRPTLFSTTPQKSLSQELAFLVQEELDTLCRHDPSFPPPSKHKRAILVISDRTLDVIAPLLHEFSYQSMVADLIGLENGKYRDKKEGKDVALDETDPIWSEVRTWHIAEVLEYLPVLFKQFTSENKAAKWEMEGGQNDDKIQGLKDAMSSLGAYTEMKAKYALHTTICEEVMQAYQARMLEKVADVEQNLVMNDPANASQSRLLFSDVQRILEDSSIEHLDKVRLIMLAIISQGGVQDSDRQRFLERGRLSVEETQAITNLSILNVRLSPSLDTKKKAESRNPYVNAEIIKRAEGRTFKFENSRFTPLLKYVAEDQCKGSVDPHVYPWVKEPPVGEYGDRPATWADPSSSSSSLAAGDNATVGRKKPSWATRKTAASTGTSTPATSGSASSASLATKPPDVDLRENGPRLIFFVLGGVTYSEMRALAELRKDAQRDVVLGSTHVWQPDGFVQALTDLHKGNGNVVRFMTYKRPVVVPPVARSPPSSRGIAPRGDASRGRGERGDRGADQPPVYRQPRGDSRGDPRGDPRAIPVPTHAVIHGQTRGTVIAATRRRAVEPPYHRSGGSDPDFRHHAGGGGGMDSMIPERIPAQPIRAWAAVRAVCGLDASRHLGHAAAVAVVAATRVWAMQACAERRVCLGRDRAGRGTVGTTRSSSRRPWAGWLSKTTRQTIAAGPTTVVILVAILVAIPDRGDPRYQQQQQYGAPPPSREYRGGDQGPPPQRSRSRQGSRDAVDDPNAGAAGAKPAKEKKGWFGF
ncbi:Sec1-like protein [Entophlyctis helioformis]|nr:Sec1-like protein [Entophlyctis helioformis]